MKKNAKKIIGFKRWMKLKEFVNSDFCLYNEGFDKTKSLFIHIPKSAGTSIGEALYGNGLTGHYRWYEYQSYDEERFKEYFVFSFCRNPYDRLVSAYFYLKSGGKSKKDERFNKEILSKYGTFEEFVVEGLGKDKNLREILEWGHFEHQANFIADKESNIKVDFLGRVENIEKDFRQLSERLFPGRGVIELRHSNKSSRKSYREYYNDELANIVYQVYEKDFQVMSYEKNSYIDR